MYVPDRALICLDKLNTFILSFTLWKCGLLFSIITNLILTIVVTTSINYLLLLLSQMMYSFLPTRFFP